MDDVKKSDSVNSQALSPHVKPFFPKNFVHFIHDANGSHDGSPREETLQYLQDSNNHSSQQPFYNPKANNVNPPKKKFYRNVAIRSCLQKKHMSELANKACDRPQEQSPRFVNSQFPATNLSNRSYAESKSGTPLNYASTSNIIHSCMQSSAKCDKIIAKMKGNSYINLEEEFPALPSNSAMNNKLDNHEISFGNNVSYSAKLQTVASVKSNVFSSWERKTPQIKYHNTNESDCVNRSKAINKNAKYKSKVKSVAVARDCRDVELRTNVSKSLKHKDKSKNISYNDDRQYQEKNSIISVLKSCDNSNVSMHNQYDDRNSFTNTKSSFERKCETFKSNNRNSAVHGTEVNVNNFIQAKTETTQFPRDEKKYSKKHISENNVADTSSKKKKKRPNKIKRQTAFQTGKVMLLTPEFHSRIMGHISNATSSVPETVTFDINDSESYPALGQINSDQENKSYKCSEKMNRNVLKNTFAKEADAKPSQSSKKESFSKSSKNVIKFQVSLQHYKQDHHVNSVDDKTFSYNKEQSKYSEEDEDVEKVSELELSVEGSNVKPAPGEPIELALTDILTNCKVKLKNENKKTKKVEFASEDISVKKNKTNKVSRCPNVLDSSAPIKRGKEREQPKPKRKSHLKKIILMEREERRYNRLLLCNVNKDETTSDPAEAHVSISNDVSDSYINMGSHHFNTMEGVLTSEDDSCLKLKTSDLTQKVNSSSGISCEDEQSEVDIANNSFTEGVENLKNDVLSSVILECDPLTDNSASIEPLMSNVKSFCICESDECSDYIESEEVTYNELSTSLGNVKLNENVINDLEENIANQNKCEINEKNIFLSEGDIIQKFFKCQDGILENPDRDINFENNNFLSEIKENRNQEVRSCDSLSLIANEIANKSIEIKPSFKNGSEVENHSNNTDLKQLIVDDLKTYDSSVMVIDNSDNVINESEKVTDMPLTNEKHEKSVTEVSDSCSVENKQKAVQLVLHTKHFREYCNHIITKELKETVLSLLEDLARFQDRLHLKDPAKARVRRRLIYGIKEVTKHIKQKKLKSIIIAPDLENIMKEGGLNDALSTTIRLASEHCVPYIFSIDRKQLGKVCKKPVPVSCVGIFNYEGSEVKYKKMIELHEEGLKKYQEQKMSVEKVLEDSDIKKLLEARESNPQNLYILRLKILHLINEDKSEESVAEDMSNSETSEVPNM